MSIFGRPPEEASEPDPEGPSRPGIDSGPPRVDKRGNIKVPYVDLQGNLGTESLEGREKWIISATIGKPYDMVGDVLNNLPFQTGLESYLDKFQKVVGEVLVGNVSGLENVTAAQVRNFSPDPSVQARIKKALGKSDFAKGMGMSVFQGNIEGLREMQVRLQREGRGTAVLEHFLNEGMKNRGSQNGVETILRQIGVIWGTLPNDVQSRSEAMKILLRDNAIFRDLSGYQGVIEIPEELNVNQPFTFYKVAERPQLNAQDEKGILPVVQKLAKQLTLRKLDQNFPPLRS